MGRKPIDGAKILVDELQIPLTPEEFHLELYGNLMDKFPNAPFLPGISTNNVPALHAIAHQKFMCIKI